MAKYKFLGYGDRVQFSGNLYLEMNQETEYWFGEGNFTVGNLYEMSRKLFEYLGSVGFMPDASFIDDDGVEFSEELQFFEEVME